MKLSGGVFPLLMLTISCFSQTNMFSPRELAKKLNDPDDRENSWYYAPNMPQIEKLDSAALFEYLNQLEQQPDAKGIYFRARFNCIKCVYLYNKDLTASGVMRHPEFIKRKIKSLMTEALNASYSTNDDALIAFVSGCYGGDMLSVGETEPAVMYLTNCTDLYEKIQLPAWHGWHIALGEIMWSIREYDKCIKYTKKGFDMLLASSLKKEDKDLYTMFCSNTLGLAYQRLGRYDSAFFYYNEALQAQQKVEKPAWKGIISGNIAQIYYAQGKYSAALPLFELDYTSSMKYELYDNAGNSLQWAARTSLALGKKDSALRLVRNSLSLLITGHEPGYVQNAYFTAAETFKALNNNDSSFYYSALYNKVHDSIEKVIYQSGENIARLRLAEEKNKYYILNLQKEKQAQIRQRNLIVISIISLSCIVLLLINRRNQQLKFKQELSEQEKIRIEQEMQSAKDQLQLFTQSLIEKTGLIEQLQRKMELHSNTVERQERLSTLSSLTILTDEDWTKFKSLFDKIYPLFFQRLKIKAPGITLAEQRMAALTRLQLTTKQMAAMQGISPDSVHKTRQRLRQRLGVASEINLEEYLGEI